MTYTYLRSEEELWTVGVRNQDGTWHPESDHGSWTEAAARVAYLNGATTAAPARVAELREAAGRHPQYAREYEYRATEYEKILKERADNGTYDDEGKFRINEY